MWMKHIFKVLKIGLCLMLAEYIYTYNWEQILKNHILFKKRTNIISMTWLLIKEPHTKKVFWLQLYIPITKNTILLFLIPYFSTTFMEHSPYKLAALFLECCEGPLESICITLVWKLLTTTVIPHPKTFFVWAVL